MLLHSGVQQGGVTGLRGGEWLFEKNPNFWAEKIAKTPKIFAPAPQAPKFLKIGTFFEKSSIFLRRRMIVWIKIIDVWVK